MGRRQRAGRGCSTTCLLEGGEPAGPRQGAEAMSCRALSDAQLRASGNGHCMARAGKSLPSPRTIPPPSRGEHGAFSSLQPCSEGPRTAGEQSPPPAALLPLGAPLPGDFTATLLLALEGLVGKAPRESPHEAPSQNANMGVGLFRWVEHSLDAVALGRERFSIADQEDPSPWNRLCTSWPSALVPAPICSRRQAPCP